MPFFLWMIVFVFIFSTPALAVTAKTISEDTKNASKEFQEEDSDDDAVDASKHLAKAPDMNPATVRDPFISFFDKKRQQQRLNDLAAEARVAGETEEVDPSVTNYKMKHSIRPHDPLEEFDLGTLKLVAIMEMGQERIAMIENSIKIGFMVRVGEYMGTNNGRIVHITSDSVIVLEEVLNPADELIVEEATLRLHPDGYDAY